MTNCPGTKRHYSTVDGVGLDSSRSIKIHSCVRPLNHTESLGMHNLWSRLNGTEDCRSSGSNEGQSFLPIHSGPLPGVPSPDTLKSLLDLTSCRPERHSTLVVLMLSFYDFMFPPSTSSYRPPPSIHQR